LASSHTRQTATVWIIGFEVQNHTSIKCKSVAVHKKLLKKQNTLRFNFVFNSGFWTKI
jgi:hypothetical protein